MQPPNLARVLHSYSAARHCDADENGTESHTRFCPGPSARDVRAGLRKQSPTTSTPTANPLSTSHDPLSAASTAARRSRGAHFLPCSGTAPCSLIAERDDGIDAHGTPRGNVTSQQRYSAEQDGHANKCQRIAGADAVDDFGDEASQA